MAIGILLAAGMGTRMRPLTDDTAKPLLKVGDRALIETVIDALLSDNVFNPVTDIYIVTGYLHEQFDKLKKKYPNVTLIHNPEYAIKNNLSSLYCVADKLSDEDVFICEADLYVKNPHFLSMRTPLKSYTDAHSPSSYDDKHLPSDAYKKVPYISGYFGKLIPGHSDDWVFDLDDKGHIIRVGKDGTDAYNMVGISFFTKKDSTILADAIVRSYETFGTEQWFWDDVVNSSLDKLKLTVFPVDADDLYEVDTPLELSAIREIDTVTTAV